MIPIYIKCSSRAAYLHRLLCTISTHLTNVGRIVLLNDGLAPEYLDALRARHPGIEERRSPKLLDPAAVALNPALGDPARFWVNEIRQDTAQNVVILEEDTWITGPLDLAVAESNMVLNDLLLLRLYWQGNDELLKAIEIKVAADVGNGVVIDFYDRVTVRETADLFNIFYVAHAVFNRDYWVSAYETLKDWRDEPLLIRTALELVKAKVARGERLNFAKLRREIICHGSATTSRDDSGGIGIGTKINARRYNAALDAAWLAGEFDPNDGLPGEIPDQVLEKIFKARLGDEAVALWRQWRDEYQGMYRAAGMILA